jgi:hypothetical protein
MRPRRLAGLLLVAGLSRTVTAHADERPREPPLAHYYFRLDYRVAPDLRGCLSRADVRELLSGQLDYDAIHQDDGPGEIVLDLSRQGGKVQARMAVDGAGEHWEATIEKASTCEDITLDALVNINAAVTVLILIPLQKKPPVPAQPEAVPPSPPPPASPPPLCAPAAEPTPLPPPPAPPPVLPEPLRVELGLSSVFSAGTAPVVTGGVGWLLGVRRRWFSAAVEGRMLFAPSAEIEGYGTRDKYTFVFAAGSVSGCFHPWGAWAFACIRGEVGALSGILNNSPDTLTSSRLLLGGVGLRLGGERILTRGLALRAYAEVLAVPLSGTLALETNGRLSVLWLRAVESGSIGIGPVLYFERP